MGLQPRVSLRGTPLSFELQLSFLPESSDLCPFIAHIKSGVIIILSITAITPDPALIIMQIGVFVQAGESFNGKELSLNGSALCNKFQLPDNNTAC